MKNRTKIFLGFLVFLLGLLFLIFFLKVGKKNNQALKDSNQKAKDIVMEQVPNVDQVPIEGKVKEVAPEPVLVEEKKQTEFKAPLGRSKERITKKEFGIFINSKNSPVQPERFSGYHTGTDFEVFPEELDAEISVMAICAGKLKLKKDASGYGGVVVEDCQWENQPVTVVYGHLRLASIFKKIGDSVEAGETIGVLGKGGSVETDGERKHLHLGIHKGNGIELRGYVSLANDLDNWIDPCSLVCIE